MSIKRVLLVSLLLVVVVAACSDDSYDNPSGSGGTMIPDSASFSLTVRPILAQRCATGSCHGSASGQGGLAFGTTNPSHAQVVSITSTHGDFVAPGNSAGSNFYLKIIATVPTPPGGARMPQGGPYLTTAQQGAIQRWINNGALDN
jgi:hypothetical protein